MVTLNTTILIELILFLIFLWGTGRFILRPVLRNIDKREENIEEDRAQATANSEDAKRLEGQYAQEWTAIRGNADDTYQRARSETVKGHAEAVADAHKWADQAVAEAREKARRTVAEQRDALKASVPEIADLIAGRLRSGGPS